MFYLIMLLEVIILFFIIFLYYILFILKGVRIFKKNGSKNRKIDLNKEEIRKRFPEAYLLISKYNINMEKITYKKVGIRVAIMVSFNLSITVMLMMNLFDNNWFLKILVGIVILIITMYFGYAILGFYYKKKGMTQDV